MESSKIDTTSNWAVRIGWLGYQLHRNCVDSFGRTWKYRTFPIGSGSVGQFTSLAELAAWVREVETMRNIDRRVEHNEYKWSIA